VTPEAQESESVMLEHLPIHPFTGLRALHVFPSGRVMWPVMGGADDADSGDTAADTGDDADDTATDDKPDDTSTGDDSGGEPPALIEERNNRKALETVLAEITGKSKSEIRRMLKKGTSETLAALKPTDDKPDERQTRTRSGVRPTRPTPGSFGPRRVRLLRRRSPTRRTPEPAAR
jgi:hypothetical protein